MSLCRTFTPYRPTRCVLCLARARVSLAHQDAPFAVGISTGIASMAIQNDTSLLLLCMGCTKPSAAGRSNQHHGDGQWPLAGKRTVKNVEPPRANCHSKTRWSSRHRVSINITKRPRWLVSFTRRWRHGLIDCAAVITLQHFPPFLLCCRVDFELKPHFYSTGRSYRAHTGRVDVDSNNIGFTLHSTYYRWAQSSVNLFRNGGTLGQGSLAGGAECAPLCSGTCWGPPCQVARHRDTHKPCAASNDNL